MSVSVVVPYFNASDTIKRCLDSIIFQTVPVLEIIVVDDGSRDEDRQYLYDLAHDYPTVQIKRVKQNQGAAHARNIGVSTSQGTWVAFLDADDAWLPTKIEIISRYFDRFDFISHDYKETGLQLTENTIAESRFSYQDFLVKNRVSTPTVILRRSKYMPFDVSYRYSEDYEAWLSYFFTNIEAIHLHITLAHGFKRAFGVSGLSANMFAMYYSEVRILLQQRTDRRISLFICMTLQIFWFFKFIIRLIKVLTRRLYHD